MKCHWFNIKHCQSCELLELSYEETIKQKEAHLKALFEGHSLFLKPTQQLTNHVEHSRNKAKLAVSTIDGELVFGFYNSGQEFKKLEECPLHLEGINELLEILKKSLKEFNIKSYDLKNKSGELKYLIISKSASHQDFMLRFVLRSKESLDRLRKMSAILTQTHPSLKVLTCNIQPEHKAILEGEEEIVLTQDYYLEHQFENVLLHLGARSFFQVTPEIACKLYKTVGDYVKEFNINSFLDLYCGVGAFSFFAALNAKNVFGVEISKEAIDFAKNAVPANKISGKIDFIATDVNQYLKHDNHQSFDVIMVNPPRRGMNSEIIANIIGLKPQYLFYSSCNALTLKRDFLELSEHFEILETQIFDMFPFTNHYETLIILKRKI